MSYIVRAVGCLLGWVLVGLTALVQMGLRFLSFLLAFIVFFLLAFLIIFMFLGHLPPLSPKLAIIWGTWLQFVAGFIVLLLVDLGLSFIQSGAIAWMSHRKQ